MVIFQPWQEFQRSCQHYLLIMLLFNISLRKKMFQVTIVHVILKVDLRIHVRFANLFTKLLTPLLVPVSLTDVLSDSVSLPFLNKVAWRSAQHDCLDLHRVFAHLKHSTRPSHKERNLKHLRCCLGVATWDGEG